MYAVRVYWAPACELLASLTAVANTKVYRTIDMGHAWRDGVMKGLPENVRALISGEPLAQWAFPMSIAHMSPAGEATGFIDWLAVQEPGALYAAFAAVYPGERIPQPGDLERRREKFVKVLRAWNDCYFNTVDPRILEALETDAEQKALLASRLPGQEVVELATNGLQVDDAPGMDTVRLTPQYHCRPMNLIDIYGTNETVYFYPVETPEELSDGIPQRLLRMGDAISDASRLKILRFLKSGPHTFTEIVSVAGLYKSTVHYHLVILRAAGLLNIHVSGHEADRYSLRPKAIDMLASTMKSFLGVEKA